MVNLASALKTEVSRLARKEIKPVAEKLRIGTAESKSAIAQLSQRVKELERQLKVVQKNVARMQSPTRVPEPESRVVRLTNARLHRIRTSLGLTGEETALLVGSTPVSVYRWEKEGSPLPKGPHLAAYTSLIGIGRREARRRLQALSE